MSTTLEKFRPGLRDTSPPNPGLFRSPLPAMARFFANRRARPRGPKLSSVSSYRVFTTIVFACVVLVDEWSDKSLSATMGAAVGGVSVIVWALTLIGSFGIGPVAAIWRAMRR